MPGAVSLDDADRAALAAATRPVDRAAVITAIAKRHGTLPAELAAMRIEDLAAEAAEGRKVIWLAKQIGRSPSLVSRLINRYRAEAVSA
jgi:hypothetical protein